LNLTNPFLSLTALSIGFLSVSLYKVNSAPFNRSLFSPNFVNSMLPFVFVFDILSGFAFINFPLDTILAFSILFVSSYPSGAFVSFIV